MKKIIKFAILLLALLSFSCKGKEITKSGKLNIITTIFPEYDWVQNIIKNDSEINLQLLVKNGVDLHSYQPSASDIAAISSCDLLIYVGGESDKWVYDAVKTSKNPNLKVLNLMEILKDSVREEEIVQGMQTHEECSENCESENTKSEPEYDEHVWLSLKNAQVICSKITEELINLKPENSQLYTANLETYLKNLKELDTTFRENLSKAKYRAILVCDRFPFRYLVEDYNLKYYAAFAGCSAETEASFETLAFLSNKLKEEELPAVIVLDQSDQKIAKTVISNSKMEKVKILKMDSLQSTSLKDAQNGKTYLKSMQENLQTLLQALN